MLVTILLAAREKPHDVFDLKESRIVKIGAGIVGVLLIIFIIGMVLSSPIINANNIKIY